MIRVVGTIEARMGSTRFPGKTLTLIHNGISLLEIVCRRFRLCRNVDEVYVATTVEPQDDLIADWCVSNEVKFYRGSESDVLGRVVRTAQSARADAIVQMGADSAYLDFELIDHLVSLYSSGSYDYVCNDLELTYPLGIYGHVVNVNTLAGLNNLNSLTEQDRENVVTFILAHPQNYRILNITATADMAYPNLRLTIDYPEDIDQARQIFRKLGKIDFKTNDIIELYNRQPSVFTGTLDLVQKSAAFQRIIVE